MVLYAGRYARADLLRPINMLACKVTKWTAQQDQELDDFMGYLKYSCKWRSMVWVGDSIDLLTPHLFADADLAGCSVTERSTSGLYLCKRGPNTNFHIAFWLQETRVVRYQHSRSRADYYELRSAALRASQLDSLENPTARIPSTVLS